MLILVTGVPGAGKSLYGVQLILDQIEANKDPDALEYSLWREQYDIDEDGYLEPIVEDPKPLIRPIYSDIRGLNIPEVKKAPSSWLDIPEDGAFVVYDECQKRYGPDGQGRASSADVQEFETHRHRGFDIVLITQHPKLLHAHIRRLVGKHFHVFRLHGSENAQIYTKNGQMDVDRPSHLENQDKFPWSYPKELYKLYKSATIHTHKKELPHFVKRYFKWLIFFMVFAAFMAPRAFEFIAPAFSSESESDSTESQDLASSGHSALPESPKPKSKQKNRYLSEPVACVSNDVECICYNEDGYRLDLEYFQCIENTHGFSMYIDLRSTSRRRADVSADS